MSFPAYPHIVPTDIPGLSTLPQHWVGHRWSRIIEAMKDGTHGTYPRQADGHPLLSAKNVQNGFLEVTEGESLISEEHYNEIVSNGFPRKGDLLVTIVGTVGRSCVYELDYPVAFQRSVCFVRLVSNQDSRFFYYLTQSKFFQEQLKVRMKAAAQGGVYMGDLRDCAVVYPTGLSEQSAIASFLDRETSKIDALIDEQKRLIDLLKEKRQAVISHAVTKGLNPHAPTKDSGIEWLGMVPAHWDVKRLKHVKAPTPNSFVDGPFGSNLKSEHFVDNGDVYVIESSFATQGVLRPEDLKMITTEHFNTISRSEVCASDIVIAKIGAQFGKSAILPFIDRRAVVSGNSLKLTVDDGTVDVRFCLYWLMNLKDCGAMDDIVNATAQPALSLGELNNLPMLVPPISEQTTIVDCLGVSLDKLDVLITEAQASSQLLSERRSALISAAVTGKIDVRGLVAKGTETEVEAA